MIQYILLFTLMSYGVQADYAAVLPSNCDQPCTMELNIEPICAFNGIGYEIFDSNCAANAANCTRGYVLRQVEMKNCLERIDLDPEFDVCFWQCPLYINRVCATNGIVHKIFDNTCLLGQQNCKDDNKWILASMDVCTENEAEEKAEKCGRACTREYNPVCGYNGQNYTVFSNKCEYEISECIRENEWNRVPVITCNRKLNLSLQIPDDEKDTECPTLCTKIYFPVCGFDGQTYKMFSNACSLKVAHCEQDKNWTKKSFFKCMFPKKN